VALQGLDQVELRSSSVDRKQSIHSLTFQRKTVVSHVFTAEANTEYIIFLQEV